MMDSESCFTVLKLFGSVSFISNNALSEKTILRYDSLMNQTRIFHSFGWFSNL